MDMECWKKSSIWQVISNVQYNDISRATPFCTTAMSEFGDIYLRINIGEKNKISVIKTFIDNVATKQHDSVQKQKLEAQTVFEKYVKPFLEEDERKSMQEKKVNYKPETKTDRYRDKSHDDVSTEITKRPINRGTEGLVLAFKDLYSYGSWRAAFEELKTMTQSDILNIECLLNIVQETFAYCKLEASTQIKLAEECAHLIVTGGYVPDGKSKAKIETPPNDRLQRYRYIHAGLAIERLKRDFLKATQQRLEDRYNIRISARSAVECFVNDCTEVTWLMSVEDPPISVHQQGSESIDLAMYDLEKSDHTVIVWPALRLGFNGPLLAKGIALHK